MLAMHAFFLWRVHSQIARGDPDFTASYTAGRMLISGQRQHLYEPAAQFQLQRELVPDSALRRGPLRYIHPPFEAVIFAPFGFLPYAEAFIAWDIFNLCLLVAIAVLVRPLLVSYAIGVGELVLAFLAFFPIFANFFQGQDAILQLLIVVLAFRAMNSRADFVAGCWLGVGLFRYQIVLPLVFILALWARRKLVSGFLIAAAATGVLSVAVVGWPATLHYPAYVWSWISVSGFGRTPLSLLPNLLGLVIGWPRLHSLQLPLLLIVLAISIALLVVLARLRSLADDRRYFGLSFGCAVLAALLVSINTSTYDLCLLVLPIVLVADHCRRDLLHQPKAIRALALPILPLLVSPLWFLVGISWKQFNLIAIFLIWWLYAIRREMLRIRTNPDQLQIGSRMTGHVQA